MPNRKIKTISTPEVMSINGELRVLSKKDKYRQEVELWILNDIITENNWIYENLEKHRALFAGTPILVAYVGSKIGDGHNFTEIRDKDGNVSASFMAATAERIVGYFPNQDAIRIEEVDNVKWIVGSGYIWTWYAQELVSKLEQQGLKGMNVSVETLVNQGRNVNGAEIFTDYTILGTTILGDDVAPAVKNANIHVLSALGARDVKKITQLKVASMSNPRKSARNNDKGVTPMDERIADIPENATTESICEKDSCNASSEDILKAQIKELKDKLHKMESERDIAVQTAEGLRKAEINRRCEAVKDTILCRMSEVKAYSDVDIAEDICNDMMTDEQLKAYAEMENADGEFYGEIEARKEVDARCMSVMLNNSTRKATTADKYVWEAGINECSEQPSGISAAISRILK